MHRSVTLVLPLALGIGLLWPGPAGARDLKDFYPSLTAQAQPANNVIFSGAAVRPDGVLVPAVFSGDFQPAQALANLSNEAFNDIATQVPLGSTVAAFTYAFNPSLNVFVRSTEGLGPILMDRAETTGRGKLNIAFAYSYADFSKLEGQDLNNIDVDLSGTQPAMLDGIFAHARDGDSPNADPAVGNTNLTFDVAGMNFGPGDEVNFTLECLDGMNGGAGCTSSPLDFASGIAPGNPQLPRYPANYSVAPTLPTTILDADIDASTYALFFNYGLTDTLDLGLIVPFLQIRMRGTVRMEGLYDLAAFALPPSEGGCGGVPGPGCTLTPITPTVRGSDSAAGIGDLLLRGKWNFVRSEWIDIAARAQLSMPTGDEDDLLGLGDPAGGFALLASKQLGWIAPHVNVAVNFLPHVKEQSFARYGAGLDFRLTRRWTAVMSYIGTHALWPDGFGDVTHSLSSGMKINPWRRLVLAANALIRLNDQGLRADVIPSVSVEYTFGGE